MIGDRVHNLPDIPDDTGVWFQSETEALLRKVITPANTKIICC